jgi:hypothetical protein
LIAELGIGAFDSYYEGDTTYDIEGAISRGLLPDVRLAEGADFAKVAWQLDRLCKKMPVGEPWRMKDALALDRTSRRASHRRSSASLAALFGLATRNASRCSGSCTTCVRPAVFCL